MVATARVAGERRLFSRTPGGAPMHPIRNSGSLGPRDSTLIRMALASRSDQPFLPASPVRPAQVRGPRCVGACVGITRIEQCSVGDAV